MPRRVGEMIVAAHHVRDPHHRVVDGVAKKDADVPSSRRMMKSPISLTTPGATLHQNSVNSITASTGTAKRSVGLNPRASLALRRRQRSAGPRIARRLARHPLQLSR